MKLHNTLVMLLFNDLIMPLCYDIISKSLKKPFLCQQFLDKLQLENVEEKGKVMELERNI